MKKQYVLTGLIGIGLLLGVTGCIGKFNSAYFGEKMFSKFDSDKDGYVDKTEYFAISTSRFERADENNDKKVSTKESKNTFIAKRFPKKIEQWFSKSDLDKDGFISYMEMRKNSKIEFFAQDINQDTKLSKEEMSTYRHKRRNNEK